MSDKNKSTNINTIVTIVSIAVTIMFKDKFENINNYYLLISIIIVFSLLIIFRDNIHWFFLSSSKKLNIEIKKNIPEIYNNDYPITFFIDYKKYTDISYDLSKFGECFLLWTLVGNPAEGLKKTDDKFSSYKVKNGNKIRLVIFEKEDEMKKFINIINDKDNITKRLDYFKQKTFKNDGKLYVTFSDNIPKILNNNDGIIFSSIKDINLEFGFISPETKENIGEEEFINSILFETGFKSGCDKKDVDYITLYPFNLSEDFISKLQTDDRYKNLYKNLDCQKRLVKEFINNNLQQHITNNYIYQINE